MADWAIRQGVDSSSPTTRGISELFVGQWIKKSCEMADFIITTFRDGLSVQWHCFHQTECAQCTSKILPQTISGAGCKKCSVIQKCVILLPNILGIFGTYFSLVYGFHLYTCDNNVRIRYG